MSIESKLSALESKFQTMPSRGVATPDFVCHWYRTRVANTAQGDPLRTLLRDLFVPGLNGKLHSDAWISDVLCRLASDQPITDVYTIHKLTLDDVLERCRQLTNERGNRAAVLCYERVYGNTIDHDLRLAWASTSRARSPRSNVYLGSTAAQR